MNNLLYLKLDLPGWGFLLLLAAVLGLVYAYYVRTLPPLPPGRRWFLGLLRSLFFIVVLLLFFNGTLVLVQKIVKRPVIAVLMDNSRSMQIKDHGKRRADVLLQAVEQISSLSDSVEWHYFKFGENAAPMVPDSLSFTENYTDIAAGLQFIRRELADENLAGVVLVSDGIDNTGDDPIQLAANFPVPVLTVLVGDTTVPRDVVLESVRTNPVLRKNTESEAEVVFRHNGFAGRRVRILLLHGKKVLANQSVVLGADGLQQKVMLRFTPDKEGFQRYVVRISPLKGEFQAKNNEKHIVVRVLKDRYTVLVFSGSPTFDRRALTVVSHAMPLLHFRFLTEKAPGQYYESPFKADQVDSADAFILYGFPTHSTPAAHLNIIFKRILSQNIPVFWMPNRFFRPDKLQSFRKILPFSVKSLSSFRGTVSTTIAAISRYPFMYGDVSPLDAVENWKSLPPVEVFPGIQPLDNADVLLYAGNRSRSSVPIFWVTRRPIKQAILAVANWGLWHFQLQDEPQRQAFFRQWLHDVLTWLLNREDLNPVQIKPIQTTVNVGEIVAFQGKVYDELFREVPDAEITVTIWNDSLKENYTAQAIGQGFYRLEIPGLSVGDYQYRIVATRQGKQLGTRQGRFAVIPFHLELVHTRARADVLRAIAIKSRGRFYTPDRLPNKFPLNLQSRTYFNRKEMVLLDKWYWLPVLILILTLEWFFRKRWGLL